MAAAITDPLRVTSERARCRDGSTVDIEDTSRNLISRTDVNDDHARMRGEFHAGNHCSWNIDGHPQQTDWAKWVARRSADRAPPIPAVGGSSEVLTAMGHWD